VRPLLGLAAVLCAAALLSEDAASAAPVNSLCAQLRFADAKEFRAVFPRGMASCSAVQDQRENCKITTHRNLRTPTTLGFSFSCRARVSRPRGARDAVTQFMLLGPRDIVSIRPVTLNTTPPRAVAFHCGANRYPGRFTLVCINGVVPYGKVATGSVLVNPDMGCDVRPLVALRVRNGNWDIFQVAKAPRTLNGPPCPGPHF
jgi:hypothetical protein